MFLDRCRTELQPYEDAYGRRQLRIEVLITGTEDELLEIKMGLDDAPLGPQNDEEPWKMKPPTYNAWKSVGDPANWKTLNDLFGELEGQILYGTPSAKSTFKTLDASAIKTKKEIKAIEDALVEDIVDETAEADVEAVAEDLLAQKEAVKSLYSHKWDELYKLKLKP